MLDRRKIRYTYLKLSKKIKDFLLSDKSREFLIFLFFFLIAGGFWLLQTLNNDYEAEFSIPVRVKDLPNNVVLTSEPPSELRVRVKDKGTVLLNYMLGCCGSHLIREGIYAVRQATSLSGQTIVRLPGE